MRSEYLRAEAAMNWSLLLIAIVNALAIVLLYSPPSFSWIFLSIGLSLQLANFAFRLKSERHSRRGQRLRHLALLQNGLNESPESTALALLCTHMGNVTYPEDEHYYGSHEEPSERRLLSNVAEAAFFSLNIAERAASYLIWGTVIFSLFIFYVLVISIFYSGNTTQVRLATQVALLIFSFIGTGEFATLAYRYFTSRGEGVDVLAECERLLNNNTILLIDALGAQCLYEVMMANCPPLPSWIYEKERKRLDDAWLNRTREKTNANASSKPS
jgi:ABC-type multidrug transport system fused ATPase/permease subunit